MAKAGQTLNDRLNAARYALAGQGLARVVCKATTEEVIGPKRKHLDYLLQCTHEPNVSIPQMANLLIERTNHSSWVVVFKALTTVHHLMCYGNERFTQYLASSNCTFQLSNFLDKTGMKGYDMSTYIKKYSKYINEKALSYRTVAFDFAKIKRGKEDGLLRTMPSEKLLKTIIVLQSQIDALLDFDCTANNLTNGVINAAFMLLFRDLIRLFACYNDGIINLLEKFFDMNKKQCREALEIYKKFLIRMDRVAEFLKVAENVGIDKGEIPDLTKAPSSLLEALEQHLQALEGNKKGKSSKEAASIASVISSSSAPINGVNEQVNDKDEIVKKALEEEAALMNQLKLDLLTAKNVDKASLRSSPFLWKQESWFDLTCVQFQEKHVQDQTKKPYNPFLSSPSSETKPEAPKPSSSDILDLFGSSSSSNYQSSNQNVSNQSKASDDLLMLANNSSSLNSAAAAAPNPFADILSGSMTSQPQAGLNGSQSMQATGCFDANFAAVFGTETSNVSSGDQSDSKAKITSHTNKDVSTPESSHDENLSAGKNLHLPNEQPITRSLSPSPTAELMRGDGTTPILHTPPETAFGDEGDEGEEGDDGDDDSNGHTHHPPTKTPPPSVEGSPFKSDPQKRPESRPPKRPPPPSQNEPQLLHTATDLFAMNEENDPIDSGLIDQRPPAYAPFSGYDYGAVNQPFQHQYIQQQIGSYSVPGQVPEKKKSAFEDLDMAMRNSMPKGMEDSPKSAVSGVQMLPGGQMPGAVFVPGAGGAMAHGMHMMAYPLGVYMSSGVPQANAAGFDAFGDILQPQKPTSTSISNNFGGMMSASSNTNSSGSLIKGDLDSSLASLAQNLDINGPKRNYKKPGQQQFVNAKQTAKTGPTNFNSPVMQPTWTPGVAMSGVSVAPGIGSPGSPWMQSNVPLSGITPMPASGSRVMIPTPNYGNKDRDIQFK